MKRKNKIIFFLCFLLLTLLASSLFSCENAEEKPSGTEASAIPSESETEEESQAKETEAETESMPEYGGDHSLALPEKESDNGKFTVVIDAGHGQRDPGNLAQNVRESDINLTLAKRVAALLSEMGYHVLLTRDDDRAMLGDDPNYDTDKEAEARRMWAVSQGADLYISIHCNAADNEIARGVRLFYNSRPVVTFAGRALAAAYQKALNAEFSGEIEAEELPEVKNNYVNGMEEDIYIVLQDVSLPAVLIEIGFMTNEEDLSLLLNDDYLWEYAHALALGTDDARKTVLHPDGE